MSLLMMWGAAAGGGEWAVVAGDFPAWRSGPEFDGFVEAQETPMEFSADKNLAWKVALPGYGCSTPVVWGERIVVTGAIGDRDGVLCYDLRGRELWRATFGKLRPGRGQRVGSGANSSPVTDGKHVFVYFKSGCVAALTMEGKVVWKTNLIERYGEDKLWWDQGTSPVLVDGKVVVAVMQTEGESYLVAFDKPTGKEVWRVSRVFETGKESGDAYTTPLVCEVDGKETIVCWGADHLTGHDPRTGRLLWSCGGFNPGKKGMWRVIASAVSTKGIAVAPYGRGEHLAGIRMGGSGDVTSEAWLWKREGIGADSSTPAVHGGRVYLLIDQGKLRGTVHCLEAATGRTLWKSRLPKGAQIYYASPLLVGDKLYCAREDGTVFCGRVTDDGLVDVKANELRETVIASPVATDGKLLIRGSEHLYCFED